MMRIIIILFFSFFSGLLTGQSPDCEAMYRGFKGRLYGNFNMTRSPSQLIDFYNELHNCAIDSVSRNMIEGYLNDLIMIDSLHCKFLDREDQAIIDKLTKARPRKKSHKLYSMYTNLIFRLKGLSVRFDSHCTEEKSDIKPNGRLVGEKRKGTRNVREKSKPVQKPPVQKLVFNPINKDATFNHLAIDDPKLYLTKDKKQFLEFCFVTKGSFNLGITANQYNEVLIDAAEKAFELNVQDEVVVMEKRYVEIVEPFHISKYELSREQYNLIVNGKSDSTSIAMVNFTEKELNSLLDKLNQTYPELHFDIPTEVEWEFAAKGASEHYYISTDDYYKIENQVIVEDSSGIHTIVTENSLCSWVNACNMIGNVKELCHAQHDYYVSEFNRNAKYVARGGSYIEDRFGARTTSRHLRTNMKGEDIGVRLIVKKKKW